MKDRALEEAAEPPQETDEEINDPDKVVPDDPALHGLNSESVTLELLQQLDPLGADLYMGLESAFSDPEIIYSTVTESPIGYVGLCERAERMCNYFTQIHSGASLQHLTPGNFHTFDYLNTTINHAVRAEKDSITFKDRAEFIKTGDFWNVPKLGEKGDCEDYALLKLYNLLLKGADPNDLHILVVWDETKEGHAVLQLDVRKNGKKGAIVFDNRNDKIKTVQQMKAGGYIPRMISRRERQPDGISKFVFYVYEEKMREVGISEYMQNYNH